MAGTEVERLNRAIVAAALAGEWETARDLRAQREAIVVAGAPNVVRLPVRR